MLTRFCTKQLYKYYITDNFTHYDS